MKSKSSFKKKNNKSHCQGKKKRKIKHIYGWSYDLFLHVSFICVFFLFIQCLVLFSFAPWCPACKNLGPIWEDFSKWQDDLDIKVGHIDVTVDVGLSGRFMVTALPTIFQ